MRQLLNALKVTLALVLGMGACGVHADGGELRAKYSQLRDKLRDNAYQRQMFIESAEQGDMLKGEVYAVLDHPFATLTEALKRPNDWCDILILPFNTKYCHPV